jgi:hypothetical protein
MVRELFEGKEKKAKGKKNRS